MTMRKKTSPKWETSLMPPATSATSAAMKIEPQMRTECSDELRHGLIAKSSSHAPRHSSTARKTMPKK